MKDASEYVFSGHRELIRKVKNPLCDVDNALLSFAPTLRAARRAYVSGMKQAINDGGLNEEVGRLPWWSGDRDLQYEEGRPFMDETRRSTGLERPRIGAGDFVALAGELLDVDPDRLSSSRQDSGTARLRRMIAAVGIERWGQTAGKLARVFRKHPVVVSRWVSEARRLSVDDPDFDTRVDALDRDLSKRAIAWLCSSSAELTSGRER